MRPYDKIFFVCTSNTLLSPIAEGIYRSKAAVYMPEPYSRGLVVLFEEPISPKVNLLLSKHEMTPGNHSQSMQLQKEELTDKTRYNFWKRMEMVMRFILWGNLPE